LLADFLITHSAEAIDIIRSKKHSTSSSPKKKAKVSKGDDVEESIPLSELSPVPTAPARYPVDASSSPATPKKRIFSNESYGSSSTETTPLKIIHPEPLTQSLQNSLIGILIYQVWLGGAKVQWARGRRMYLDYRPFFS
jgi:hypothetical protein